MFAPEPQLRTLHAALNAVSSLPEGAWSAAKPFFSLTRFAAGVHVVEAGAPVRDLHFLVTGLARYYYLDAKGREFNKSFSVCGQVLSSVSSLVTGETSPFYVQTLAPSECLSLRYQDFLQLTERYPEWNALRTRLLEQLVIKKERREADFLLLSAEERYLKFLSDFAHVVQSIPNYHIASYLGVTDVALSRIRRRMGLTPVNARRSR